MPELTKRAMMLRCTYLYYCKKKNIQEIGRYLGVSRFRVSRFLKEAEESGIVQIRINDTNLHFESLSESLEQRYNIDQVVAVPVTEDMDSEMVRRAVGHKGVEILKEVDKGVSIGVTWGRTIAHMVEELPQSAMEVSRISELAGGLGMINTDLPTSALASLFAKKVGASCYQLSGPIIASDRNIAENIMTDSSISKTLEAARHCEIAVCGLATISPDSMLYHANLVDIAEFEYLRSHGAVGSIIGRFFDAEGQEIDSPYREKAISISWDDFLAIPNRIILAGGWGKKAGVSGLLAGKVATTIIVDSITASSILSEEE